MSTIKILLIGDEPNILRTLRRNLVSRGYEVLIALDDQEAAHIFSNNDISLFVLNLNFETIEIDGLVILQEIREQNQAPIIVLSPIGTENQKIEAFDLGADDYLVLPFGMGEFLARTRSALRRWSAQQAGSIDGNKVIVSGNLLIDVEARLLLHVRADGSVHAVGVELADVLVLLLVNELVVDGQIQLTHGPVSLSDNRERRTWNKSL